MNSEQNPKNHKRGDREDYRHRHRYFPVLVPQLSHHKQGQQGGVYNISNFFEKKYIYGQSSKSNSHLNRITVIKYLLVLWGHKIRLRIRPEDYRHDVSLRGEFVRLVMDSDLAEDEKEQVLRLGVRALAGEG